MEREKAARETMVRAPREKLSLGGAKQLISNSRLRRYVKMGGDRPSIDEAGQEHRAFARKSKTWGRIA